MNTNKTSVLDAKELRIGNFVYCKIYDKQIKMESFFGLCNIESRPDLFEPIPLTEEWLLKLGFTKLYGCFGFETQRGNFIIEEDLCEITGDYNDIGFMAPCGYVHQLQNLYFALTGSELTVA